MIIGFTGTQTGMTEKQKSEIRVILSSQFQPNRTNEFHHGLCVGADVEAAEIAHEIGFSIVAHPGHPKGRPDSTYQRGTFINNHRVHDALPYLERNHIIVDNSDLMIATPAQEQEVLRSGTWATIRYAIKRKPIITIYPDGLMSLNGPII